MHSSQHSRGRVFVEVLCIWALGGSFVAAWLETGTQAHVASAAAAGLLGLVWASGLFAGRRAEAVEQAATDPVETTLVGDEPAPRIEIFAFDPEPAFRPEAIAAPEPEAAPEPLPAVEAADEPKPKRRARKARTKAEAPVVEIPVEVAAETPMPHDVHIEQLFDPQPFARQARPAFGRRARGPRPLPAA